MSKEQDIFITGGTGMLGASLIKILLNETSHNIIALKRKSSKLNLAPISDRITWVEAGLGDYLDYLDEVKKCEAVIHAAGYIAVGTGDMARLIQVNQNGTENIIDAALEAGVKRFIHVSSVAALGREKDGLISEDDTFEDHPLNSDYAVSKYGGDKEAYRGRAEGLMVHVIRPSLILGAGFWDGGSDSIVTKVDQGLPYYPHGGTGLVDVRDVAKMILRLLKTDQTDLDVICSGHNVTFEYLQRQLAHHLEVKPPSAPLPSWVSSALWRFEKVKSILTGKKTIITRSSLKRSNNTYFYDSRKGAALLNMEYIPLDVTLRDVSLAYKKYKAEGHLQALDF